MNEILTFDGMKRLSTAMCVFFVAIHIVLTGIFFACGVMPMVAVNILSLTFFAVSFYLIRSGRLVAFVIGTFIEMCVHIGFAVIMCGWNVGFQITLFGACILLFYADYAGRSLGIKTVPALLIAPVAGIIYTVLFIVSSLRPAPYPLPHEVIFWFQIAWSVLLFIVAFAILYIFLTVATRSQETLANEMLHDKLTGLPNRYYITRVFKRFSEAAEIDGYWLAIADLDDFKHINDTYGHNCGDYVLKTAAKLIKDAAGECELCRWGGEEFLIVSSGLVNREETLKRVCAAVGSYRFRYDEISFRMTLTVGSAVHRVDQGIADWIDSADKKLYIGKSSGKNQYVL